MIAPAEFTDAVLVPAMLCRVMVWAASGTPKAVNVTVSLACGVTPVGSDTVKIGRAHV